MRKTAQLVCVYLFEKEDERDPGERLWQSVKDYESRLGLPQIPEEKLKVERTTKGKPYFPLCPELQFSISHSGKYWACAVSLKPVGLDLQEHVLLKHETREDASLRFRKMAGRFFHPTEARFVERSPYDHFFTVWTAREAYVKYTGQGIDKDFSELLVIPAREEAWPPLEEPAGKWQAMGAWFHKKEYGDQYSLCICAEGNAECVIVDCKTQRNMGKKDL